MAPRDGPIESTKPIVWMHAIRDDPDVTRGRLLALYGLAARMGPGGTGHASEPQLMTDTGLSYSTVHRALQWARDTGRVERTRRGHRLGNGGTVASEWALILWFSTCHQSSVENGSQPVISGSQPVKTRSQPVTRDVPRELGSRELEPESRARARPTPTPNANPDGDAVATEYRQKIREEHTWLRKRDSA